MNFSSSLLFGCAVCFGDPGAPSSKALIFAVFFLGAMIGSVLCAIAWTAFIWSRRARSLESVK